ncbi:MAG TPA: SDR family oxidoreductase [Planctomycetaceae bacterium]|jgi:short-subunit dehydrogenase|nr:SDR family oxidoreductase [Planctomycetaceae bacterium]
MSENVLVLGATSGIAKELCAVLARRECRLVLAARNLAEAQAMAADLEVRYRAKVAVQPFDALDFEGHAATFAQCLEHCDGHLDGVILCYGYLPKQDLSQNDFDEARRAIDINFTSAVSILNVAANYFERQRRGYIAAISSVGGDRGRQSNYAYGSAKAGLTAYLQGLRNRLHFAGVHVLTIKPGFVDTPMIQGVIRSDSPLVAKPERVARDIDRAIRRRQSVLYTPWFWRPLMAVIRAIPEPLMKRLRL